MNRHQFAAAVPLPLAEQKMTRLIRRQARRTALRWLWCAAILVAALMIAAWVAE